MESILLAKHGLKNFLAGCNYNFRQNGQEENRKQYEVACRQALALHGMEAQTLIYAHQAHTSNVSLCDAILPGAFDGNDGVYSGTEDALPITSIPECDGLITATKNVALMVKFADCTPILFFDPKTKVQAVVHSGWRGTVQKISLQAIRLLQEEYSVELDDLLVFIGPSIDQNNYEVGQEVYDAFEDIGGRSYYFIDGKIPGKYYLSMQAANTYILRNAGIPEKNLEISPRSTFTDLSLHSARREGKDYGLNAIFTMIE